MQKVCQSCGMPLKQGQADLRGSNLDGTRSDVYCNKCYLNGKFTNEYITVDEMIALGINGVEGSDMNRFKKWLIKKSYPQMVRKLDRWK